MIKRKVLSAFLAFSMIATAVPLSSRGDIKLFNLSQAFALTDLSITQNPSNQVKSAGETAIFSVVAEGDGLTYQWQYKGPKASNFADCGYTGNKTPTLKVQATDARNGNLYRCIVTDANNNQVISEAALLTVGEEKELAITSSPENQVKQAGETAYFTVIAEGTGLTYQWQYKGPKASNFADCGYTGNKTPTLKVQATDARNGHLYRCVVTDAYNNQVTSEAALLTVGGEKELAITSSPENQIKLVGETAYFTVTAEGTGLTYQWQYKGPKASNFADCGYTGNKTDTLKVAVTEARNGYLYRCIVTDANNESLTSEAASLTIPSGITITNPENVKISANESATFEVEATGTGSLTYAWYYCVDGKNWIAYEGDGYNTASITVKGALATSGTQYRCTVSDAYGQNVTSEAATLTVEVNNDEPVAPNQKDIILTVGQKYQLDLVGEGYIYASSRPSEVSVSRYGVLNAKSSTSDAKVYVIDTSGNIYYYNVYVVNSESTTLTVSEKNVTVNIGETYPVTFSMPIDAILSNCMIECNTNYDNGGYTYGIKGVIPGQSLLIGRGVWNPGVYEFVNVTVEANVTEIEPGVIYACNPPCKYYDYDYGEYRGTGAWYHIKNDSDVEQKVNFRAYDPSRDNTNSWDYGMDYGSGTTYSGKIYDDYSGEQLESFSGYESNEQIVLAPGEGLYFELYNEYDYTYNTVQVSVTMIPKANIEYEIGNLVENVEYSIDSNTEYFFTPETSGDYMLSFIKDDENSDGYYYYKLNKYDEYGGIINISNDYNYNSYATEKELQAGYRYGLTFYSTSSSYYGTLSFSVKPIIKNESTAEFNKTYSTTVSKTNEVWYKLTVTGTAEENFFDEYSFVIEGDNIGVSFYDENKNRSVDYYDDDNCIIYDPEYSHYSARHYKAYGVKPQSFWVRIYAYYDDGDHEVTFKPIKETVLPAVEASIDTEYSGALEPYTVTWYKFTAPEAGNYVFDGRVFKPESWNGCGGEMTFYNYVDGELKYNNSKSAKRTTSNRTIYDMAENETVYIRFVTCDYIDFGDEVENTDNTYLFKIYKNTASDTRNVITYEVPGNYYSQTFYLEVGDEAQYEIYYLQRHSCNVSIYKDSNQINLINDYFYPDEPGTYRVKVSRSGEYYYDYYYDDPGSYSVDIIQFGKRINNNVPLETEIAGAVMPYNSVWYEFTVVDPGCYSINYEGETNRDWCNVDIYYLDEETGKLNHQGDISSYGYSERNIKLNEYFEEGKQVFVKITTGNDNLNKYTISMDKSEFNPYVDYIVYARSDMYAESEWYNFYSSSAFLRLSSNYIPENTENCRLSINQYYSYEEYHPELEAYLVDSSGRSEKLEQGENGISVDIPYSMLKEQDVYIKLVTKNGDNIGGLYISYTYPYQSEEIDDGGFLD